MKNPLVLITSALSILSAVCLGADSLSILPKDARLAIAGDSITEQKLYSKFIEGTSGNPKDTSVKTLFYFNYSINYWA